MNKKYCENCEIWYPEFDREKHTHFTTKKKKECIKITTSFELPKEVVEKMHKNKWYDVKGFWNGYEWYFEIQELEK